MRSVVIKVFWMQPVKVRSEELSVCLGSYLRGVHGDVNVDASGKEVCRSGRLAKVRAATRVKPEQAPKDLTWRSSCPHNGEDHWRMALENRSGRTNPPGYWAQHAQKHQNATREICRGALVRRNDSFRGRPTQKSEELIVCAEQRAVQEG
jgi:hypothetical protein